MKSILFKICIVLSLTASIDFGLGLYLDSLYQKNQGPYANGHLNYYLQHIKADTLIMGSSRAHNHVDTRLFSQNTYNLSHASMHIGFQAALIDILEQKKKLPKQALVLHIEANELGLKNENSLRNEIQYLNYYYNMNDYVKSEINKISAFEFIKHWSSLYRFSGFSSLLITNPYQNITEKPKIKGYHPLIGHDFNDSIDPNFKKNFDSTNPFFNYLDHINKICRRNSIQLICFTSPYFKNSAYEYAQNQILGHQLSAKKIPYFNYASLKNRLPVLYKDNVNWYDHDHLNEKGAELFTRILKVDLKSKIN